MTALQKQHAYSIICLVALLAATVWSSGATAAAQGLTVLGALSLPGFTLLGWTNPLSQPIASATRAAAGIGLSLVALVATGLAYGKLSPIQSLTTLAVVTIGCFTGAALTKRPSGITSYETAMPWLAILGSAMMLTIPLTGAATFSADSPSYRPFFNADFFKHLALSQSLAIGELPPIDPFGARSGPLHYYWLQYLVPATAMQWFAVNDPAALLKAIGIAQTALFTALLFGLAERTCAHPLAALIATLIGIAGLSLDGVEALLEQSGAWLETATEVNQEALDFTTSLGARTHIAATTLFRLCLYIPQHQLCAILFLACLLLANKPISTATWLARAAMLTIMPLLSLLLGAPAVAALAIVAAVDRQHRRSWLFELAPIPVAIAILVLTGMVDIRHAQNLVTDTIVPISEPDLLIRLAWFIPQLFSNFGVILFAACCAPFISRPAAIPMSTLLIPLGCALTGYILAESLLPFGRMRIDSELKLSLLVNLVSVPLAAHWLAGVQTALIPRWQAWLGVTLLGMGIASPLHDVWWHSRYAGTADASGTTVTIPSADMQAQRWIRANISVDAVLQQYPEPAFLAGGRDTWIPIFSGRRLAASMRGTNTERHELEIAQALYSTDTEGSAADKAIQLGADYLYLSPSLTPKEFAKIRAAWQSDPKLRCIYEVENVSVWQVLANDTQR